MVFPPDDDRGDEDRIPDPLADRVEEEEAEDPDILEASHQRLKYKRTIRSKTKIPKATLKNRTQWERSVLDWAHEVDRDDLLAPTQAAIPSARRSREEKDRGL